MIVGILLAAGQSRRFGADKRLHQINNGTPMLIQSLRNMRPAVDRLVVVVRNNDNFLLDLLQNEECQLLMCPEAEMGMGHTLAYAVKENIDTDGCLIGLADMPFIKSDSYMVVANAIREGVSISRPLYRKRAGHPVGFSNEHYRELCLLKGDKGARQILGVFNDQISYQDCDDPGVLIDIDLLQDINMTGKMI